jgi:5-hydroxyisourate hydrolase-like protein (transthyretin family)
MDVVISVVVVDAVYGRPAEGVALRLESLGDRGWGFVCCGHTDDAGGWTRVVTTGLPGASHRLVCEAGEYYAALGLRAGSEISVAVVLPTRVAIMLAPFGHSVLLCAITG